MNIAALIHIVENNPELIEGEVPAGIHSATTIGVAKSLIGKKGNVEELTENQRYHYVNFIRPLVENVVCDGVFGPEDEGGDGCIGNGRIDDGDLAGCYIADTMLCQQCRHAQDNIHRD